MAAAHGVERRIHVLQLCSRSLGRVLAPVVGVTVNPGCGSSSSLPRTCCSDSAIPPGLRALGLARAGSTILRSLRDPGQLEKRAVIVAGDAIACRGMSHSNDVTFRTGSC